MVVFFYVSGHEYNAVVVEHVDWGGGGGGGGGGTVYAAHSK